MDTLKGVVGLGGKKEEGKEPVSGAKGEGTTAEPFDAGNDPSTTQAADQTQDTNASKSEPAPAPTQLSTTAATEEQQSAKAEKKGGFLSSIGLGGSKKKEEEKDAHAGAEKASVDKTEAEKHLPPNHLGSAVPEGASKDLADPGTVAPGQTDGIAAQQGGTTSSTEPAKEPVSPTSPISTSAGKQPDRGDSVGSGSGLSPDRARSTGGGGAALLGSRGEHRGSMIPADAPKYRRVENPDRIPTAGGKRIGEEQYQTRRASVAPSASPPRDMAKLDREGSPDPVTAGNTASNTIPASAAGASGAPPTAAPHVEGKNTAPQQMKEFSMGDASKEAEQKPVGVGATEDVAPDEGKPSGNATAPGVAAGKASTGKENTSGGGHARRGSVFDKLKDKLKGSKNKN